MSMTDNKCKTCGKPLKEWYSSAGGETIIACSDIKCNYKEGYNAQNKSDVNS